MGMMRCVSLGANRTEARLPIDAFSSRRGTDDRLGAAMVITRRFRRCRYAASYESWLGAANYGRRGSTATSAAPEPIISIREWMMPQELIDYLSIRHCEFIYVDSKVYM